MYISTAEPDKELTAVASLLLPLHGCGRHGVPGFVIMFIPYNMCACLCVRAPHAHTSLLGRVLHLALSVNACVFQVQWVSVGRLNTRQRIQVPHSSLHKLPAHYCNAAHLA